MWLEAKHSGSTPVPWSDIRFERWYCAALVAQSTMLALPTIASTPTLSTRRWEAFRASMGSPLSSSTTNSRRRPRMPPLALTDSKYARTAELDSGN
ncbi:hypothetical protein D9M69_629130 [compost metagenome]